MKKSEATELINRLTEHLDAVYELFKKLLESLVEGPAPLSDIDVRVDILMENIPYGYKKFFGNPRVGTKYITLPLTKRVGGGRKFAYLKHELLQKFRAEYSASFGRKTEQGAFRVPIKDVEDFAAADVIDRAFRR